jgi:hypothetical protein
MQGQWQMAEFSGNQSASTLAGLIALAGARGQQSGGGVWVKDVQADRVG